MFSNAEDFNEEGSQIHLDADALRQCFLRAMREHFPLEALPRPHAPAPDPAHCVILGRGLHSSTFQLNLSRLRHKTHPRHPLTPLHTPFTPPI
jgi:hypothetical protein